MSNLSEIYVKTETLEKVLQVIKAKNEKGVKITLSTSDSSDKFGQNVSAYISQSKEQRDEKKPKFYVGNGKVFWSDGKITVAEKQAPSVVYDATPVLPTQPTDDLPF